MGKRVPVELKLNELMLKNNDTVESLADALNVTEGDVLDWKNGKRDIPVRHLKQLTGHYKCSADYLLSIPDYSNSKGQIEKLSNENEALKHENQQLLSKNVSLKNENSESQKQYCTNNNELSKIKNRLELYEKRYGKLETDENGAETFGDWIINNLGKVFLIFWTGVILAFFLFSCGICISS